MEIGPFDGGWKIRASGVGVKIGLLDGVREIGQFCEYWVIESSGLVFKFGRSVEAGRWCSQLVVGR